MFLRSARLAAEGVNHGFSLRSGGVSAGPWASLNLGGSVGDDPVAVEENLRRLAAAAGFARAAFRAVRQVHGVAIREAGEEPFDDGVEADALIARRPGLAVAVKTADCVPVLLFDRGSGHVAAVHAGWRGTDAGIAGRAVKALGRGEIVAAIGPCIRRCCYEVSPELASRFRGRFGADVVEGRRLDLVETNRLQLLAAGVAEVEVVGGCTACDADSYFSHRRDEGRTGRHLSFAMPVAQRPAGRPIS